MIDGHMLVRLTHLMQSLQARAGSTTNNHKNHERGKKMEYYAQIFTDEILYAATNHTCKNGNAKAVIISSVYKKAKHTTIQNKALWMKIDIENVPPQLLTKLHNKLN